MASQDENVEKIKQLIAILKDLENSVEPDSGLFLSNISKHIGYRGFFGACDSRSHSPVVENCYACHDDIFLGIQSRLCSRKGHTAR